MPQPAAAVAALPDYHYCLAAHPYYLGCIRLWTPPAALLASADANIRQAAPHLVHLLEDGAAGDAKKLYAAAEPILRQTGVADLADALRALIHIYEKDFAAAGQAAAKALAARPDCAEYHYLCGIVAAQIRDIPSSVAHCHRALERDPELSLAAMALALIHTLNRDWAEGLSFARRAKKHEKEFNPFLVDLCLLACSFRLGQPNESPFDLSALDEPSGDNGDELAWLPPVEWPETKSAPLTIFVYCDHNYLLEHATPLAWSLAETGARNVTLHLHVANPEASAPRAIEELRRRSGLSLDWSHEQVDFNRYGNPKVYHSCARFCRLSQFLAHVKRPVLALDADILFRQPPGKLAPVLEAAGDMALQFNPDGVFWESVCATGLFARPTPAAFDYLGAASRFIVHNLRAGKGRWYLDQIALGLVFEQRAERLKSARLPLELTADGSHGDSAVMWSVFVEKNADDRYNAYKRELLARYGDLRKTGN